MSYWAVLPDGGAQIWGIGCLYLVCDISSRIGRKEAYKRLMLQQLGRQKRNELLTFERYQLSTKLLADNDTMGG